MPVFTFKHCINYGSTADLTPFLDPISFLNEYNIEFNKDGTFDVHFDKCGDEAKNNLPIVDGWNFLMRVYEPKLKELDSYKLPTQL